MLHPASSGEDDLAGATAAVAGWRRDGVDPRLTRNAPDSTHLHSIPADSNCRGAALFPTKSRRNHSNSSSAQLPEISTSLGDQGSKLRVLSPRDSRRGVINSELATAVPRSTSPSIDTLYRAERPQRTCDLRLDLHLL